MPLSKQAKALFEAALRRKGLQPGKAVRQDPRTFVGPIQMERDIRRCDDPQFVPNPKVFEEVNYNDESVPRMTYYNGLGRNQDLLDELYWSDGWHKARRSWYKEPFPKQYERYYSNRGGVPKYYEQRGDAPKSMSGLGEVGTSYNDDAITYKYPRYVMGRRSSERGLTRLGELELEARMDEYLENEYKKYLMDTYSRWPTREDAERGGIIPQQYLDELYPEEY